MLALLAAALGIWALLGLVAIAACIRSSQLSRQHRHPEAEQYEDRAAGF